MLKHITATASTLALLAGVPAMAQQAPLFSDLSMPNPQATPHPEYVRMLARQAYIWGWPMVNMQNRHDQITQAPEPGLLGGILPVAPQGQIAMLSDYILPSETFVTCPNQDVVYGLGFFDLDEQPVIVQVPDFGDRFWVYALYDARTDQFGELGKPYGTKPGFYMLVGPNWDGETPEGVTDVIRSSTALANTIPRVFKDDTPKDGEAVQALIDQVVVYPLDQFDGTMKTIDWSDLPEIPNPSADTGGGETQWVVPEKFFDQFGKVLETVAPLPGEDAMYAQFKWLLDVAAQNEDLKQAIVEEAVQAEKEIIKPFFRWEHNGKPAGNGWNRSVNNADWGVDYFDRTGTAKSNMFDNRPSETQYYYTDYDVDGNQLDGAHGYTVTFAAGQEPPVDGFWSLTLYNDKHLFAPNELDRYSLGTKSKNMQRNEDGSLTIHVGHASPGENLESNWLPAPDGEFSLYIRAYWGQEPITDGTWQPPAIKAAG
ncbi:DUF1254 domain-containing protein [Rhodobacteraceae bacterium F11138]|nr:DUF1254 domain-containing protein [Rhodobacteraceae bacterium F11138]